MDSQILNTFITFNNDPYATKMYVTGAAGTGKTTELRETVQYCIDNGIDYQVCAYTHKAVEVLKSKMPKGCILSTLHSYLKKYPKINESALTVATIDNNTQTMQESKADILFVDEFSMIGSKDVADLTGKTVFLGDLNQLPPVKDSQGVVPEGAYHVNLTKVYRQKDTNPLLDTLTSLVTYINGAPTKPLEEHKTLKRSNDLVSEYKRHDDAFLLAYTNANVQKYNQLIQGRDYLEIGDTVFSPTIRKTEQVLEFIDTPTHITNIGGKDVCTGSKFKTLEKLATLDVQFIRLGDYNRCVVFGHSNFKKYKDSLAKAAVQNNQAVATHCQSDPKVWCKSENNWKNPICKARGKAWSEYISFNSNVICVDFAHATTIHKSQGSTYKTVLFDLEDVLSCTKNDRKYMLQLMYTAMSRASEQVFFK